MTHTAETVRAACERAGILLERSELRLVDSIVASPSHVNRFVTAWTANTIGGGRVHVGEASDGELWYDGRRIFSVVPDPAAPKSARGVSASQTALEVAIEYAQNDLASMDMCELQGVPAHLDEADVKAALRDLEVVSAAELARLRQIERCARLLTELLRVALAP